MIGPLTPFSPFAGLYGRRSTPDVLLLDLSGTAIEDANNPGEYWTITSEENEAIQ